MSRGGDSVRIIRGGGKAGVAFPGDTGSMGGLDPGEDQRVAGPFDGDAPTVEEDAFVGFERHYTVYSKIARARSEVGAVHADFGWNQGVML